MAKLLILLGSNSNPNLCRSNGKNGQGLKVPKWVLINWPKILQMPQNLSVLIVCPSPKVKDFEEKRLLWASVVLGA